MTKAEFEKYEVLLDKQAMEFWRAYYQLSRQYGSGWPREVNFLRVDDGEAVFVDYEEERYYVPVGWLFDTDMKGPKEFFETEALAKVEAEQRTKDLTREAELESYRKLKEKYGKGD